MQFKPYRILLLACTLLLPACAIKGYNGPDLPDDKLATVSLKAPVASLIPLFWIFPLNMLTWFSEDWYETSWNSEYIYVTGLSLDKIDQIETGRLFRRNTLNQIELDRFNTVSLFPGKYQVGNEKKFVIDRWQIGSEECSTGSCTCTTDDKKKKTCSETTTCKTPYRETAHDYICKITIDAKAGEKYKVFIRDHHLMLSSPTTPQTDQEVCYWGADYSYETTSESTNTSNCSP